MTDVTLLPCPFCGSGPPRFRSSGFGSSFMCAVCDAEGPITAKDDWNAATEAWNRRSA